MDYFSPSQFSLPLEMDSEVVHLCQQLISIKSYNPPGNELEIAQFILEYLKSAGLHTELIPHTASRASVIAFLPGKGDKKNLLFSAHMDTVPVGIEKWVHDPYQAEQSGGKIWGRGSSDMKGGLAAMLLAARTIAISKMELAGDLVLALSAGEEVDMLGANVLVTHPKLQNLQGMLVAEPTSNELVIAEKGILWLEITTTGKTAHGSMPEYGRNAIEMMLTFIHELNQLDFISVEHPLLGKFSRSLNTIQGGIQTNVVPDQCKITLDMRTVPGQEHSAIIKQINELIATLKTKDPGFSASLRSTQAGPALSTQADDPMVKLIGQVINHVSGVTPTPKGVRYFTDAAIYAPRIHAPLVICGPGKAEMAHQPDEYIEIDKLIQAAKIYSLIGYHLLK